MVAVRPGVYPGARALSMVAVRITAMDELAVSRRPYPSLHFGAPFQVGEWHPKDPPGIESSLFFVGYCNRLFSPVMSDFIDQKMYRLGGPLEANYPFTALRAPLTRHYARAAAIAASRSPITNPYAKQPSRAMAAVSPDLKGSSLPEIVRSGRPAGIAPYHSTG